MNVLGHPYVAYKVFNKINSDMAIGSFLNDLVPFIPNSVFEFQEIHEGGEKFLTFLNTHYPQKKDIALAMLTHGVTYGADKFSRYLENRYEAYRDPLSKLIVESASNISYAVASKYRFHNFLWWGIDVHILRSDPEFIKLLGESIDSADLNDIANLLSECFEKDLNKVQAMLKYMFSDFDSKNLSNICGLATIWKNAARGLPEKDEVDVEKCVQVFEYCADIVKDDYSEILAMVIKEVKENISKIC